MKVRYAAFGVFLSVAVAGTARAQVPTPTPLDCELERCSAAVKDAVAACSCETAPRHGAFVSCVAKAVNLLARDGAIHKQCKGKIKRCAARSTCGKPNFETCTRTQTCLNGTCVNADQACMVDTDCPDTVKCKVMRSAPTPTPDRCEAKGGTVGTGSCCPACP